MKKKLTCFLFASLIFGQNIVFETFESASDLPEGWSFVPDPDDYPDNTGKWMVSNGPNADYNINPPAATYYWAPSQWNTFENDYEEHYMYSPVYNVDEFKNVIVRFQIALDGYPAPVGHYNGMNVSYSVDGNAWVTVLNYEINSASEGDQVDIDPVTESFYASMEESIQLRWEAYGSNSYYIDAWHIDNVRIDVIPTIDQDGYARIFSSNGDDNQKAIPGDIITLEFKVPEPLSSGSPFVLINATEVMATSTSYLEYVSEYTVPVEATDGPISFSIDFTTENGISGPTCRNSTDGSNVLVDVTGPVSPTITDNVIAIGGNSFSEVWNSTNEVVQVDVEVPNDTSVVAFNYEIGNSVSMIGNNGEIIIPLQEDYKVTDEFTFEVYIQVNETDSYQGFLDFGDYQTEDEDEGISNPTQTGFGFFLFSGGWRFYLKTTGTEVDDNEDIDHIVVSAPVNTWIHLAARFQSGELILYRDGIQVGSRDDYSGPIDWGDSFSSDIILGSFTKNNEKKYFDGKIDEVRFWNIARTENQIKAYRNVDLTGSEEGLIGYWRFDEGTSTIVDDLSSLNNSAGLESGATWSQDSPFQFQQDSLDTDAIIGSSFQMLSRVQDNDFSIIGNRLTIEEGYSDVITLSAPASELQAIQDFGHGLDAQFSARLFDQAGNSADGEPSATLLDIDIVANQALPTSIKSDNDYSYLAKSGDELMIEMNFDEYVEIPTVTIEGNTATVTETGSKEFTATYSLDDSVTEGDIEFSITVVDTFGNQNTYETTTNGTSVYFDKTNPTLDLVTITSNNFYDSGWAKEGDSIRLSFSGNESISADYALGFDGADDFVEVEEDNTLDIINNITVEAWVYYRDVTRGEICVKGNNWEYGIVNGQLEPSIYTTSWNQPTDSRTLDVNTWYHVAMVYDGTNIMNYINAVGENVQSLSGTMATSDQNVLLGKWYTDSEYLDGYLDEVRVWNIARTQSEIESTMHTHLDGDEVGLVAYWNFNEGSNNSLFDISLNGNDGLLKNMNLSNVWQFQRGSGPSTVMIGENMVLSKIGQNQFIADYLTTDTDEEGKVQFEISYLDRAGNNGATVISTTNNSRVIYDRTAPTDFTVSTVFSTGGNEVSDTWNSTNTVLNVTIPIDSDSTLINGWSKILAKIGSNLYEVIDSTTITESNLGTDKILTLTEGLVESINGFNENDTISIKAIIADRAGNTTEGAVSENRIVIDQTPPNISDIHIESNNPDSTKAKIGDIITVSFTANELINGPTVTISNNNAIVENPSGFGWNATYSMTDSESEGNIIFYVSNYTDVRGNPADGTSATDDGSKVVFDKTKPDLDIVTLATNNTWSNTWAKVGDLGIVNINASEDLLTLEYKINGSSVEENWIDARTIEHQHIFSDLDEEGRVPIEITYSDSSGNIGDTVTLTTDNSYIVFDNTPPSNFTVGEVNSAGGNVVELFWNSTNTSLEVAVPIASDTTLKNGRVQVYANIGDNTRETLGDYATIGNDEIGSTMKITIERTAVRSVTGYEEEEILILGADIYDVPGNQTIGVESVSQITIEEDPPSLTYVSYRSNFSDSTLATVGHEITITLKSDEGLQEPSATISENMAVISKIDLSNWNAKYVMQDGNAEGIISFEIDEIIDVAGNPGSGSTASTDGSVVTFDNTKPILDLVRITSNNIDSTWAKIGDTISLIFKANELLSDQSADIFNESTIITELADDKYLAEYEAIESNNEGLVNFEIMVIDSVGLVSEPVLETTNSSAVTFDKTLPILTEVHIESNNDNNRTIAITGDDIILTFRSDEPLIIDSILVTIANEIATLSQDGEDYIGTITLSGDEPGGILSYTIDFLDRASNRGVQVTQTTDDSYVNHDIVPPELLSVSIYSNNQDSTWAKPGDTVFVKFLANEALDNLDIIISNSISSYIDDGAANYRGYHIMEEDDEEGEIQFNIEYTDIGGATGPSSNSTTDGTIVKYDKTIPEITNIRMSSNNSLIDSAGIGDIDSLFFTSSEMQRNVLVSLADSIITPLQNSLDFIATRELLEDDTDGWISFSITLEDSAGNSTGQINETDDGSGVWFDGTYPELTTVSFNSSNINDPGLAIEGDTLFLDFISTEELSLISISIAGNQADTTFQTEFRTSYRSIYVMNGSENEGYIPLQIDFSDLVGNQGQTITSTTNGTSILFDMTPPIDFQIDTIIVLGGNVIENYWNASNDSIVLKLPIPLDDESLIGGYIRPQARFGEGVWNFGEGEFIDCGDTIQITSIPDSGKMTIKISQASFESTSGYADNGITQFTAVITDRAGNETIGLSDETTLHIDETIPVINEVNISSNNLLNSNWAIVSDSISLVYVSSEGLYQPTAIILEDSIISNANSNGTSWNGSYIVNEGNEEGPASFSISFSDTAGNYGIEITETTDGSSINIDNTSPLISDIFEGAESQERSYYNNSDTITVYWTQSDEVSGIAKTYYALGSNPNSTNISGWTEGNGVNYGGWNGLNLINDETYFSGAFVRDSAGNYSDTIWSDGVYIDTEIPVSGFINDGQWIIELDYTPDSTSLNYSWNDFSDNIGIDYYELSIGTDNDTINILDWYKSDSMSMYTLTGLDLERDTLYYTYIRAVDSANNYSNVVKTDGIYFDDSEPRVMEITPNFDSLKVLSILQKDTIKIKFNRLIYFYDLKISSKVDSNLVFQQSYADSVITITLDTTLSSNDTLTVYLDSALAYNTLFVSDTLNFYSQLWGDFNYDYDLSIEDILLFNQLWPNTDLGPFSEKPPHIRPLPDGETNLTDLITFAKMWQWRYFRLSMDTVNSVSRIDGDINVFGKESEINIPVPNNTSMAELLIGNSNLDIEKMRMVNLNSTTFLFKSIDTLNQIIQFSLADNSGLDSNLTIFVPKDESNLFFALFQYRFLDVNGHVIVTGSQGLNIELLPEKFQLYDNYPNPFNSITTINYDLPKTQDVEISIFDILGRRVKSLKYNNLPAGRHSYKWSGVNDFGKLVSTGIYFFQIKSRSDFGIKKMLLLK